MTDPDPDAALKEQLLALARSPGNCDCADCGEKDTQWAAANLGIFICITCAGIHRKLGVHVSRVKSTMLDTWKPEDIAVMQNIDPAGTIKEQWIRAKYVRKLYQKKDSTTPSGVEIPSKEGFMTKKGEVVKNWKRRWFVLYGSMLFYYKKQGDSSPAGWVNLQEITRLPECLVEPPPDKTFCISLHTPTREYLINADNGEEMFDWIQLLRTAKTFLGTPSKYGFTTKASEVAPTRIEQIGQEIPTRIPVHKWKINGKMCSNCLHGTQLVDFLVVHLGLESRAEGASIGQTLLDKGTIRATVPIEPFSDSSTIYSHS